MAFNILPSSLSSRGEIHLDKNYHLDGGFADVFRGIWGGKYVAVKRVRTGQHLIQEELERKKQVDTFA